MEKSEANPHLVDAVVSETILLSLADIKALIDYFCPAGMITNEYDRSVLKMFHEHLRLFPETQLREIIDIVKRQTTRIMPYGR